MYSNLFARTINITQFTFNVKHAKIEQCNFARHYYKHVTVIANKKTKECFVYEHVRTFYSKLKYRKQRSG